MKSLVLILFLFLSATSYACPFKYMPSENFDEYVAIFTGEVTGIHLIEYQSKTLKALDDGDEYYPGISGITPYHEVTVIVNKVISGDVPALKIINAGGCSVHLPRVHMDGVFFLKSDGSAITIYGVERPEYSEYLLKLGKYKYLKDREMYLKKIKK